jgi:hypothetical protein
MLADAERAGDFYSGVGVMRVNPEKQRKWGVIRRAK